MNGFREHSTRSNHCKNLLSAYLAHKMHLILINYWASPLTMPIDHSSELSHHFLVAMPSLDDLNFKHAVIYVCEHNEEGAMGLIINKPLQINLGNVLHHLNIDVTDKSSESHPVLMGGPVGQEHGFIIHNELSFLSEKTKREVDANPDDHTELVISSSKEMLSSIAQGKGPAQYLVTLGYTGWEAGQLENEIAKNDWLVIPYDENILFKVPMELRWQMAPSSLGIDINQISGHVGHA